MHDRLLSIIRILIFPALLLSGQNAHGIVQGTDAAPGEFPWVAGIVRTDVPRPGLVGGGTLVGNQWVITAAHAVRGIPASRLEVWLRGQSLTSASSRIVTKVLAVYVHPSFAIDGGTSSCDLAMLLLDRRVTQVPVLSLDGDPESLAPDDPVQVAGWGTSEPGVSSPTPLLQKADLAIVAPSEAEAVFGPVIGPWHLAAVDPAGITTPCVGDSGSPLIRVVSGQSLLAGVVSFGVADCSDASKPVVFSNIPYLAPWIQQNLALTAAAPVPRVYGKNRLIASAAAPRIINGSDLGNLRRPKILRTMNYRLTNSGKGLLTVQSVTITGKGFSLTRRPAGRIAAGASQSLQVRFRAPAGNKRFTGRVTLMTNSLSRPSYVVKLSVKVLKPKPKKKARKKGKRRLK